MVTPSEIAPPWTERCDTVFPASATISWPLGESRVAPLPLTNCQAGSGGRHPLDSSVFNPEPGATQHAVARLKVLDLFSGIGGFSLGLERTGGFETVAFCEIDPFCRRVLAKHWAEVRRYDDIRNLCADRLAADGVSGINAICGGFPCQDVSYAGLGAGLAGERSGLFFEYARL